MTRRSKAREVALQLLFQMDQNAVPVPRVAINKFVHERLQDDASEDFAFALYDGVIKHQKEIDEILTKTAEKWRLTRMMPVDRNVLRMGAFELLHNPEPMPTAIVINEAIELARRFATDDSPSFVNGILDKIAQSRVKPSASESAS
ncbi:MAG: transcription antitermination factor NusB [Fimbriiglobus sp.]